MADFQVCFKRNFSSETTMPNSMKLYRKLHYITRNKNTAKHKDLPTATTKWPTSIFALKSIFSEEISLKVLCQV